MVFFLYRMRFNLDSRLERPARDCCLSSLIAFFLPEIIIIFAEVGRVIDTSVEAAPTRLVE